MITFPNAKINLGLYVTGRRPDGFHDLETVFYPIGLCDALELIEDKQDEFSFNVSGLSTAATVSENLCVKALWLLKKDFPQLPGVQMHLHKVIPVGAGLGGGSADAASTLQLLNSKFQLNIPQDRLLRYALQLGSDCPFFVHNKPSAAKGRGEILERINLDLSGYYLVLIHPKIHVSTGWAFTQIRAQPMNISLKDLLMRPPEYWRDVLENDFEKPVFEKYPLLRSIKENFYNNGALYSSMSGSGSGVYALFKQKPVSKRLKLDKDFFLFTEKL